ncbi:conserved membrane protein, unknown function, partial [Hepatocystis sp. ex Piliocolobus tephrosceles]
MTQKCSAMCSAICSAMCSVICSAICSAMCSAICSAITGKKHIFILNNLDVTAALCVLNVSLFLISSLSRKIEHRKIGLTLEGCLLIFSLLCFTIQKSFNHGYISDILLIILFSCTCILPFVLITFNICFYSMVCLPLSLILFFTRYHLRYLFFLEGFLFITILLIILFINLNISNLYVILLILILLGLSVIFYRYLYYFAKTINTSINNPKNMMIFFPYIEEYQYLCFIKLADVINDVNSYVDIKWYVFNQFLKSFDLKNKRDIQYLFSCSTRLINKYYKLKNQKLFLNYPPYFCLKMLYYKKLYLLSSYIEKIKKRMIKLYPNSKKLNFHFLLHMIKKFGNHINDSQLQMLHNQNTLTFKIDYSNSHDNYINVDEEKKDNNSQKIKKDQMLHIPNQENLMEKQKKKIYESKKKKKKVAINEEHNNKYMLDNVDTNVKNDHNKQAQKKKNDKNNSEKKDYENKKKINNLLDNVKEKKKKKTLSVEQQPITSDQVLSQNLQNKNKTVSQHKVQIDNIFPNSITSRPDKEKWNLITPILNEDKKSEDKKSEDKKSEYKKSKDKKSDDKKSKDIKKNSTGYYKLLNDPYFFESKVRSISYAEKRKNKKKIEQKDEIVNDKREEKNGEKRHDKLRDTQKHDYNMKKMLKQKKFINEKRHGTKQPTRVLTCRKNDIKKNKSCNYRNKYFQTSKNETKKKKELYNDNIDLKLQPTTTAATATKSNNNDNVYKSKDEKKNDINLDVAYKTQPNGKPSLYKNRKNNNTNKFISYSTNYDFFSKKREYYEKKTKLKNSICLSNSQIYSNSSSTNLNTISSLNEMLFTDTVVFCNFSCLFFVLTNKFKTFLLYIEKINQVVQSAHMKTRIILPKQNNFLSFVDPKIERYYILWSNSFDLIYYIENYITHILLILIFHILCIILRLGPIHVAKSYILFKKTSFLVLFIARFVLALIPMMIAVAPVIKIKTVNPKNVFITKLIFFFLSIF